MSRAVIRHTFGGPEVLEVRETPEPHAGAGEVRIAVRAAGLNPMDWAMAAAPELAAQFDVAVPCGFGCDFAGVVDEVGAGAKGFVAGDRVHGGALAKAVADFVVTKAPVTPPDVLFHTPAASATRWRLRFRYRASPPPQRCRQSVCDPVTPS